MAIVRMIDIAVYADGVCTKNAIIAITERIAKMSFAQSVFVITLNISFVCTYGYYRFFFVGIRTFLTSAT